LIISSKWILFIDESSGLGAAYTGRQMASGQIGGNHMPASRKKTETEYWTLGRPQPLPPHFGEIDVTAPFDPIRYYTMLRCTGDDPSINRCGESVMEGIALPLRSNLRERRFREAMAWANTQDKDRSIRNSYLKAIIATKPDGNFIHYLG
jgi:hypothetical protein